MKDITLKPETLRKAIATATLKAPPDCIELLRRGETEKGDALKTARVAGILAAKRCDEMIPLCHPLPIYSSEITFVLDEAAVHVQASVETIAATGVEMEALLAVNVAALTIYDMLKPHTEQENLVLTDCKLLEKTGGKSHFKRAMRRRCSALVVVLSDSVAQGKKSDTAGRSIYSALVTAGFDPIEYRILPDESAELDTLLKEYIAQKIGLIITVGGTGLGPRDKTVEVVAPLLTQEIPGIMEAARTFGQQRTPYAMLSRGVAGFAQSSLVITFPGSRRGAEESLAALLPGLVHLLDVFNGQLHTGGYV